MRSTKFSLFLLFVILILYLFFNNMEILIISVFLTWLLYIWTTEKLYYTLLKNSITINCIILTYWGFNLSQSCRGIDEHCINPLHHSSLFKNNILRVTNCWFQNVKLWATLRNIPRYSLWSYVIVTAKVHIIIVILQY